MLSIGKLAAGPDAGLYYEEAVVQGREDYYAGEGEAPGRWVGSGSARLGLSGQVMDGEVGHLLAAEHPASGGLLGAPLGEGSVAGFDLTFKAPKSVSIVFGIGDPQIARELQACHECAVDDALGYLEREACRARRGTDGVHVIDGAGFLAAGFQHRTSRAGDPLLHTHVVVANRTLGPDGRWTALDARPIYRQAKTAGFVYQARLRHEVTQQLGLRWAEVEKGTAELVGFDRELIEHFSRRRAEIVARMELHGSHSLAGANAAALATRKGKDYGVPMSRLREQWYARAMEHGMTPGGLELFSRPSKDSTPRRTSEVDLDALTERSSTFTRRDVLQAVCEAHRDGATMAELPAATDTLLARPEIVRIADPAGTRFTTQAQLDLEQGLLDRARDSQGEKAGLARPEQTEQAIAERGLSEEQAEMVRALTSSGHGIEVVRAAAGTGKTFALDAARQAWQDSHKKVIGCALAARAAAELRDQAGIDTTTITRLTTALDQGYRLPIDGVLIVDEAGMVGTRDLAKLADHAEQTATKLVLVGDDRQLPEIAAGGAFRAIADRHGAIELTDNHRQREAWDRDALTALRDGKLEDWASAYVDAGRIVTAPNAPTARAKLADDWFKAREHGADARMIAHRRSDVEDLNHRGRQHMRDAGHLRSEDHKVGGTPFAAGDEVAFGRNDPASGVFNGDRGTVTDIGPGHVDISLERANQPVRIFANYIDDGHLDYGYATTAHKAQGATVDQAFVLGSDDLYREWGYTALTRHRDSAHFYVNAPDTYLNQEPELLTTEEQMKQILERTLDPRRFDDLATDALGRAADPLEQAGWTHGLDHDIGMDFGP